MPLKKYKNTFIDERVSFLVPKFFSLATLETAKDKKAGGSGWDVESQDIQVLIGWKNLALDEFNTLRFTYPDNSEEDDRTYSTILSTIPLLKRQLTQEIKARSATFSDIASEREVILIANKFGSYLSELFAPYTRIKNLKYRERVELRIESDNSFIRIHAKPYLEEANQILDNIHILAKKDWVSVSVALAVLTGRRMSEIHHSAQFSRSKKDDTILFKGQLKGKSRKVGRTKLIDKEFEIPVLGNPTSIIKGLQWLERHDKRLIFNGEDIEDKNTLVNKKWGKQLASEVKTNWNFLEKVNLSEHPNLHPNDLKSTYHKMRALYAASLLKIWQQTSEHSHRVEQKLTEALCDGNPESAQSYKRYLVIDRGSLLPHR